MLKINRIELTGTVPFEVKRSTFGQNGVSLSFTLSYIQGDGDRAVLDTIRVVAFGRVADDAAGLEKSAAAYVAGEFQLSRWEKDGVKQVSPQVLAREIRAIEVNRERLPINGREG